MALAPAPRHSYEMRALALLLTTLTVLAYQWFVIRTALGTGGGTGGIGRNFFPT